MIGHCQGDDSFVAFQLMGIFIPGEKWGIHFFPKMSTAPVFILVLTTYSVKSSVLHWYPVSHDSVCMFNDRINIRENRGL